MNLRLSKLIDPLTQKSNPLVNKTARFGWSIMYNRHNLDTLWIEENL